MLSIRSRILYFVFLYLALESIAIAERPPVVSYTTQQGLAMNFGVRHILQDQQGYLWIGTVYGLSRFDGEHFKTYRVEEGLQNPQINALIVRRSGELIAGTNTGLFLYEPLGGPGHQFRKILKGNDPSRFTVIAMHEDQAGVLWVGTEAGLFRMQPSGDELVPVLAPLATHSIHFNREETTVAGLARDNAGTLWIAIQKVGLFSYDCKGATRFYGPNDGLALPLLSLFNDRQNRLWAGTGVGLLQIDPTANGTARPLIKHRYTTADGVPEVTVFRVIQTQDGHIWAGTRNGLVEISSSKTKIYSVANGLTQSVIPEVFEDRDGMLWLGTEFAGVMRLSRAGVTVFGEEDGLQRDVVDRVLPARSPDAIAVVASKQGRLSIHTGGTGYFKQSIPSLPLQSLELGVDRWQTAVQDAKGRWWVPVHNQIQIFPTPWEQRRPSKPMRVLGKSEGVPDGRTGAMFADRDGDIWIGVRGRTAATVAKCSASSGQCETLATIPGQSVLVFEQSRSGTVWIGCTGGGLFRWTHGKFQEVLSPNGHNQENIDSLHVDDSGTLWFTHRSGVLLRLDDQDSETPHATSIAGVSAPYFRGLTSDRSGRLYVGSLSGVIRYDPRTQEVRRYQYSEGLPSQSIHSAARDRNGFLWFATAQGLVRIEPKDFAAAPLPEVFLSRITLADEPVSTISDRGETHVRGLRVKNGANRIQIEFGALSFQAPVRYQYQLEGIDRGWSTPADSRIVIYPKISTGKYRFLVRAIAQDNRAGPSASADFEVIAPFWMRWWFVLATMIGVIALLTAVHRYRVAHLLGLEQLKVRIATDLHDDLGASLAQIAIVSEELRGKGGEGRSAIEDKLAAIAASSREMTASLSDIVWSIRPDWEGSAHLVSRMRRVGNDLCEVYGAEFLLVADALIESTNLEPNVCRQIFLVFKEALHNALRHGASSRVDAHLSRMGGKVVFQIVDNGTGFVTKLEHSGNGLRNMRRRAAELGGSVVIESAPSTGTSVTINLPIGTRNFSFRK